MGAQRNKSTKILSVIFMLPITLFLLYSVIIPFVWNVVLSFQKWDGMGPITFVGLDNYVRAFGDKVMRSSIVNSIIFALGSTIGAVLLGLLLAILIFRLADRSSSVFRLILFSPAMLPTAVVGLMFTFMYNPEMGLINNFLKVIGLESLTRVWLQGKGTALICIIIASIWKASGSVMLLCFASMQTIPHSLRESAMLDGAGYSRQMRSIVIPLIKPMILLAAMNTLGAQFKTYDLVFVMTQGGPGNLTYTPPIYMTKVAFTFGDFGYAAAMGVIFTVVVIAFLLLTRRLLKGESYEL